MLDFVQKKMKIRNFSENPCFFLIQLLGYPIPARPPRPPSHKKTRIFGIFGFSVNFWIFAEILNFLDFFVIVFGFFCDFLDFSNALSNHCTVAWVTRPERPKGVKRTKSSRPEGPKAVPKGRYLEVGPWRGP